MSPVTPKIVLQSIFSSFDKNNDKKLSTKEFYELLDGMGINDTDHKLAFTKLADLDNDNLIDFQEFCNLIQVEGLEEILSDKANFEFLLQCYKTFNEYDTDGDGEVSWTEFWTHLANLGYTKEYITQYWYFYDADGSSTITMNELFNGFLKQQKAYSSQKNSKNDQMSKTNVDDEKEAQNKDDDEDEDEHMDKNKNTRFESNT